MEVGRHRGDRKLLEPGAIAKKTRFSELAESNPGSSFRQMQVTIVVFGLEKQLWLCFISWPIFV